MIDNHDVYKVGVREVLFVPYLFLGHIKYTRNTLDLSAIPVIKKYSHLPVIVDPSHASGLWWLVEPLAKAALVVGADGIMVEVHNDPAKAKCDGQQSIKPARFKLLMDKLRLLAKVENKNV